MDSSQDSKDTEKTVYQNEIEVCSRTELTR